MINSEAFKNEKWIDFTIHNFAESTLDNNTDGVYPLYVIAAFHWDYAYVFRSGTTKREIEEIIGFKDKNIPKVINEGYAQMLFVGFGEVTCSLHGKKDYHFGVGEFEGNYLKTSYSDRPIGRITKEGDIIKVVIDPAPER
jgi:hypothetical protein